MRILFLHGWTSVPGGRKPTFLKEQGHDVINPALPDDDFDKSGRIIGSRIRNPLLQCCRRANDC
jgi:hypothetical protein